MPTKSVKTAKRIFDDRLRVLLVSLGIAIVGTIALTLSHAAGPTASIEAESGNLANGATIQTDSAANGNSYVELNPSSTSQHFSTLPVGATLPSDATCAAEVKPAAEVRPANAAFNSTAGVGNNSLYPRVDGNYTGTTDEILQWAACKWGIDEDIVRAQAAKESYWFQRNTGDFTTDTTQCPPLHNTLGADGTPGECPESIGILQDRYPYHMTAFVNNNATLSTAYNVDYAYASWYNCYTGQDGWLNQFNPPTPYAAGDAWGCVGLWFSGRWYDSGAVTYINAVKDYYNQKIWTTPGFINYQ